MFSGIIIGEFTLLCVYLQDTSGSRAKDHPVVSSPVPITTAPAAAAHGKLLVLTHPSVLSSCICKIAVFFFFAVHPHPHAPPTSALLPVMSTVTAQPGLPTSSHVFQV